MGSVDPCDAYVCVRVAAPYGWTDGGLCDVVGSSSASVDPGSPTGTADLTPPAARGKAHKL